MPSDLSTGDWIEVFVGGTLLVAFVVCLRWIGWKQYWRKADPTLDWWKRPRSFFPPLQWIRDFAIYNSGKVTQVTLNVSLPSDAGTYYPIFNNRYSLISPKAVQDNVTLQYKR